MISRHLCSGMAVLVVLLSLTACSGNVTPVALDAMDLSKRRFSVLVTSLWGVIIQLADG